MACLQIFHATVEDVLKNDHRSSDVVLAIYVSDQAELAISDNRYS